MNYTVLGRLLFTFLAIQQSSESAPLKLKRNTAAGPDMTCEQWRSKNNKILENLVTIDVANCDCSNNSLFKWHDGAIDVDLDFDKNSRNITDVRKTLIRTLPVMKRMSLVDLLKFEDCCEKCLEAKTNILILLHLSSFMVSGLWYVCI